MSQSHHHLLLSAALAAGVLCAAPPPEPLFEKVPPPAVTALRIAKGKMISTGLVFVNGKLLPGPYIVSRHGTAIKVNREQVTGQVVPWSQFVAGGASRPAPRPVAAAPAAPPPPPSSEVDDLFEDAPAKPASSGRPSAPAPVAAPPPPAGDYVDTPRTRALLKRINEFRTDVDRTLRGNGMYFFGVRHAPVRVEARQAEALLAILPNALRDANDARQLQGVLRSHGITYLPPEVCADLMRDRALFMKIRDRVREIKEEQSFRRMLEKAQK